MCQYSLRLHLLTYLYLHDVGCCNTLLYQIINNYLKKKGGISQKKMELVIHAGFEPTLPRLKVECFTIKLMNHVGHTGRLELTIFSPLCEMFLPLKLSMHV